MSEVFNSIAQGLMEAIDYEQGKEVAVKIHKPVEVDILAIREQLGFTQAEFAAKFCINLQTLKRWEKGEHKPQGIALTLFNILQKEPEAVLRALN
jgi:putative transcriptional regulator